MFLKEKGFGTFTVARCQESIGIYTCSLY